MQNLYFPIQKEYEISRNFSEIFNILKIPSFFKAKADKQLLSFKEYEKNNLLQIWIRFSRTD